METKICNKCKKEKKISEFYKRTHGGYNCICKECVLVQNKKWRLDNIEKCRLINKIWSANPENKKKKKEARKIRNSKQENREKENAKRRERYKKDLKYRSKKKEYYANLTIKAKVKEYEKLRRLNPIFKEKRKKRHSQRYITDISYKLSVVLRSRLGCALKNNQKVGSAVKDLGCSVEELKVYLESKFQEGMSWDNWSKTGWHIDHIIPLSSFNLEDPEEFKKACHYTNLQPLWAEDNLRKSNNYMILPGLTEV